MGCRAAKYNIDDGYICNISGDRCVFIYPNSKKCTEEYGEGPDANKENNDEQSE